MPAPVVASPRVQPPELAEVPRTAEPWVCLDQLAYHLARSVDSIYRRPARLALPGHRVGLVRRFKVSEVDAWVRVAVANETAG